MDYFKKVVREYYFEIITAFASLFTVVLYLQSYNPLDTNISQFRDILHFHSIINNPIDFEIFRNAELYKKLTGSELNISYGFLYYFKYLVLILVYPLTAILIRFINKDEYKNEFICLITPIYLYLLPIASNEIIAIVFSYLAYVYLMSIAKNESMKIVLYTQIPLFIILLYFLLPVSFISILFIIYLVVKLAIKKDLHAFLLAAVFSPAIINGYLNHIPVEFHFNYFIEILSGNNSYSFVLYTAPFFFIFPKLPKQIFISSLGVFFIFINISSIEELRYFDHTTLRDHLFFYYFVLYLVLNHFSKHLVSKLIIASVIIHSITGAFFISNGDYKKFLRNFKVYDRCSYIDYKNFRNPNPKNLTNTIFYSVMNNNFEDNKFLVHKSSAKLNKSLCNNSLADFLRVYSKLE